MIEFDRVDKIFDFAISREEDAHKFYMDLIKRTEDPELIKIFKELAEEELCHKGRLRSIKEGKEELFRERGTNIEVDDCCVRVEPGLIFNRKDIIDLVLKKEEESVRLYKTLAATLDWGGLRETFLLLAQEESKHKLRFHNELKA